jgi:Signal peptidase (SPase) II
MKEFSHKDYLPKKLFLFMVPALLIINYGITNFAKYLDLPGVKNALPFSLNIDSTILYAVFGFTVVFLVLTKMLSNHPLSSSFIVAGALYNLIEKSIYGHVFDFIKITWGFINLADLMLWFGLILLNYEVWFNKEDEFEQIAYGTIVETKDAEEMQKPLPKPLPALQKKVEEKISEPLINKAENESNKLDVLSSLKTSKIKTVTDQLNKIKSADSQEIFVPKMDIKPKKQQSPRIIVNQ